MIRAGIVLAALLAVLAGIFPMASMANPEYRINPGDQLDVQVVGEQFVTQRVLVANDGRIGLPLVGSVRVAGLTPAAAGATIARALHAYIRSPQVSVAVLQQGQITVMVLGDVKNAGKYTLRSGAHVSDALASAGGFASVTNGAYPDARIAFADGTTKQVPLEALLRGGDASSDVVLGDRAALYVPGPITFQIQILGAVDRPGSVTVNLGDRLSMGIAKAGNSSASAADLTHIMVTRTEADGTTASHEIDLYRALQAGDLLYDPQLRRGDVVYVPSLPKPRAGLFNPILILQHLIGL